MKWFTIAEATAITSKSDKTIRLKVGKYKKDNPAIKPPNNIFKYEYNDRNTLKLYVSSLFLQTYFQVDQATVETPLETLEIPLVKEVETESILEDKYKAREQELKQYFENQLNDIKEAKQQTIDLLKEQLDKTDYNLNKVLEQYSMAQLTIQNLTTPQDNKPLEISNTDEIQVTLDEAENINIVPGAEQSGTDEIEVQEILEEQQKSKGGLRTTEEYYKENYPTIDRCNSGLSALLDED
jgi:hypothetical protein